MAKKATKKKVTKKAVKKLRSFQYIGNPVCGSGPVFRTQLGHEFAKYGVFQEVTDEEALEFENLLHFKEYGK